MSEVITQIESGLSILDEKEETLKALAEQYEGLTVDGLEDKEGFKKVKDARLTLKNERVSIKNAAEILREPAVRFQKKVIEREKQLIAIIGPLEDELHAEEKRIEVLKEDARKYKEMMEANILQDRLNALAQYNFAADYLEVKHMSDDEFDDRLAEAKLLHEEELKRQEEIKAEEDRKRKEEDERLKAERGEFERQKAEQEKREAIFKAESDRLFKEQLALEAKQREESRRIEKEQEAKELAIRAEREKFEEEKRKHEESIRLEQAKKEAADRAVIEEQARIKREAEEKAECERIETEEALRQEALKPDKEKLGDWCNAIVKLSNSEPKLSDQEAVDLASKISERLYATAETLKFQIDEL